MFKDQLHEDNAKLMNLIDALENKDRILSRLNRAKWMNIVISGILWIASMIVVSINPLLFSIIFGVNALLATVSIVIQLHMRLIDGDNLDLIIIMHGIYGLLYSIVYSFVSI